MPLTSKQVEEIKEEVLSSKRPLFFFHDDPDGLSSFLLLYRMVNEGIGIPLKTSAEMGVEFAKKVQSYQPDKVFILDKPGVSQDFIDAVNVPIIWIDHHTPQKRHKIKYYNPRIADANEYTANAYLCYQVSQQDDWIAMVGCAGDQYVPPFLDQIKDRYHNLIEKSIKKPGDILFDSKFGKLAKMFSFCLKGHMDDVRKCIKIMTRIKTPYELLNQETPAAKFIYKRFQAVDEQYQKILKEALNQKLDGKILLFLYNQDQMSLNQDLANELLYNSQDKIIIIGRKKSGEVKLSFRTTKYNLPLIIQKALEGCEGYGGGHEHAAGANVKETDFDRFIEQFKAQLQ
jgi:nanoRNase/pAp phosphatase (c-di-AMP/oligoRNAs hydrolase)